MPPRYNTPLYLSLSDAYSPVEMSNESLPDSGGHYYDSDSGGFLSVARRNFSAAKAEVTSGDAGKAAVGTAIGFGAIALLKRQTGDS